MPPTEDTPDPTRESTLDLNADELYELLASDRRRLTFATLADRSTPIDLPDLAAAVAARETDGDPADETTDGVAVALHHAHLPKLDDAGVVEYDRASRRVSSGAASLEDLVAADDAGVASPEVASALAAATRRLVLEYFDATGEETATLADLARHVADSVDRASRPRVRRRLHHTHLPKLAAAGLVRYDADGRTVTCTERGRDLSSTVAGDRSLAGSAE